MIVDKVSQIYLVENCVDVDKIAECVNLDGRGSTYNDKTSYSSVRQYDITTSRWQYLPDLLKKHLYCLSSLAWPHPVP